MFAIFLLTLLPWSINAFEVSLSHVSTVYVPSSWDDQDPPQPVYEFDEKAVEKAAIDVTRKMVYAVGYGAIHVIDASTPERLSYVTHVRQEDKELTDVALCGGYIFVSYSDTRNLLSGGVLQYKTYSGLSKTMEFTRDIKVGTVPDMVKARDDCTLVVALENEAVVIDGALQDPPGGIAIIRFPQGVANNPETSILDFTKYDGRFSDLEPSGVRWVFRGENENNPFSNDVEPEYVTFNKAQTKAYVTLQENNAVATVDLTTHNIIALQGLGFKNWSRYNMDPSDEDNGINLGRWNVMGMYQPDGLDFLEWKGQEYIVTANEGSTKDYYGPGLERFDEDERGHNFKDEELSPQLDPELRDALKHDMRLGRLQFSKFDGKDSNNQFRTLYAFGGRSFSVRRASDMAMIYDSGDDLETKMAAQRPGLFNNNPRGSARIQNTRDERSDNRGIEPESITVAKIKGYNLIFIGCERPGAIAVYSISDTASKLRPRFQSLYTGGIPRDNTSTWEALYRARTLHALDPESLTYISPEEGLAPYPLLLVTGTDSGTVSLLRVHISGQFGNGASQSTYTGSIVGVLASLLFVLLLSP